MNIYIKVNNTMHKTNRNRWKFNKHKKPFFLNCEIYKAIREGRFTINIACVLFSENVKSRYIMSKPVMNVIKKGE